MLCQVLELFKVVQLDSRQFDVELNWRLFIEQNCGIVWPQVESTSSRFTWTDRKEGERNKLLK